MSLVQFPDRLAANSPAPYNAMQPYLDFVAPAAQWFDTSSYGQFQLSFAAPQVSGNLGWITMNQNANLYTWDAQTHNMFAYSREAFQHAYDNWGIRADDYDMALIMPARGSSGLFNGPGNINRDPTDGEQTNTNQVANYDEHGTPHYVSTVITAGNAMFSWGYRWLNHEADRRAVRLRRVRATTARPASRHNGQGRRGAAGDVAAYRLRRQLREPPRRRRLAELQADIV